MYLHTIFHFCFLDSFQWKIMFTVLWFKLLFTFSMQLIISNHVKKFQYIFHSCNFGKLHLPLFQVESIMISNLHSSCDQLIQELYLGGFVVLQNKVFIVFHALQVCNYHINELRNTFGTSHSKNVN